jgi:hypothetical protein
LVRGLLPGQGQPKGHEKTGSFLSNPLPHITQESQAAQHGHEALGHGAISQHLRLKKLFSPHKTWESAEKNIRSSSWHIWKEEMPTAWKNILIFIFTDVLRVLLALENWSLKEGPGVALHSLLFV